MVVSSLFCKMLVQNGTPLPVVKATLQQFADKFQLAAVSRQVADVIEELDRWNPALPEIQGTITEKLKVPLMGR